MIAFVSSLTIELHRRNLKASNLDEASHPTNGSPVLAAEAVSSIRPNSPAQVMEPATRPASSSSAPAPPILDSYGDFSSDRPFVTTGQLLPLEIIDQILARNPGNGPRFATEYEELLRQPVDAWSADMELRLMNVLRENPRSEFLQANVMCRATGCELLVSSLPEDGGASRAGDLAHEALRAQDWLLEELVPTPHLSVDPSRQTRLYRFKKKSLPTPPGP